MYYKELVLLLVVLTCSSLDHVDFFHALSYSQDFEKFFGGAKVLGKKVDL